MSFSAKLKTYGNNIRNKLFNSQPADAADLSKPTSTELDLPDPSSICLHCLFGGLVARGSLALEALGLKKPADRSGASTEFVIFIPPIHIVSGMNVEIIQQHIIKLENLKGSFEEALQSNLNHFVCSPEYLEFRIKELNQEIEELRQIYELEQKNSIHREQERRFRREFKWHNRSTLLKYLNSFFLIQ